MSFGNFHATQKHKQIFLIFLAYYFMTCASNAFFIFGPFFEKQGGSPQQAGMFLSVFYLFSMACRTIGSKFVEKFNIRRSIIYCAFAYTITSVVIALSLKSPMPLFVMRALNGVAFSIYIVAAVAAQSLLLDETSRGVGFALFTTGSVLPLATVVPLCEFILKSRIPYLYIWVPAILGLLCVFIGLKIKDLDYSAVAAKENGEKWGSYRELFAVRGVKLLLVTTAALAIADAMCIAVSSISEQNGFSVSAYMTCEGLAAFAVRTFLFKYVVKVKRVYIAVASPVILGISLLLLTLTGSTGIASLCGILSGVGIGTGFPNGLALMGDMLPAKYYPKASGLILLIFDLGWMIMPVFFGFVSPIIGITGTFVFVGSFAIALSLFLYVKFWKKQNV